MMKTKFLSLLVIPALLFASCSSDNDPVINNDPVVAKFSSGDVSQTYVTDQGWTKNDAIGIYMFNTGTTTIAEGADNKKYLAQASSATATLLPDANQTIYYPRDVANKVDFLAYYPHLTPLISLKYPVNVATQSSQSAIDFMLADKVTGKDKGSTTIALNFQHKLCKVILKVQKGEGVPSLNGLTVKIKGMKTKADFDMATGILGVSSEVKDIVPANGAEANTFQAILLPGMIDHSHILEFTLGTETYRWDMFTGFSFLYGGNEYTYTITVNKMGVSVSSSLITPWDSSTPEIGGNTAIYYAVGDYYPDPDVNLNNMAEKKKIKGVVCWLEDPVNGKSQHGKIVSLQHTPSQWGLEYPIPWTFHYDNGRVAMKSIKLLGAQYEKYPAFKWVHGRNPLTVNYEKDSKHVWYLPAILELKRLYAGMSGKRYEDLTGWGTIDSWEAMPDNDKQECKTARSNFSNKVEDAGGDRIQFGSSYWSSSGYVSTTLIYAISFNGGTLGGNPVDGTLLTRAIYAF